MLIVEGMDGTGKSTIVDSLSKNGFERYHFEYDVRNQDLMTKYLSVLSRTEGQKIALDRSFISELVYGPVLRGTSRLNTEQLKYLLQAYNVRGFQLVYLNASKETLLERRKHDQQDYAVITSHYDQLYEQYNSIIGVCSEHIPTHRYDTDQQDVFEVQDSIGKKIR